MKNIKLRLVLFILLMIFNINLFAQDSNSLIQQPISGGVLNGKATNLVKPNYPQQAKMVNASGAVNVQVVLDEEGNIIFAQAVSGHPLLRAAAVQAARASKFSPTLLDGKPVKVAGVIVYLFYNNIPMSWLKVGYELVNAEQLPELSEWFPSSEILNAIPFDWKNERELAIKINTKKDIELEKKRNKETVVEKSKTETEKDAKKIQKESKEYPFRAKPNVPFVISSVNSPGPTRAKIEESYSELSRSLIDGLTSRLSDNQLQSWYFKLGQALSKTQRQIDDESSLRINLEELRQLSLTAPSEVSSIYLEKLKNLAGMGQTSSLDAPAKENIKASIKSLLF